MCAAAQAVLDEGTPVIEDFTGHMRRALTMLVLQAWVNEFLAHNLSHENVVAKWMTATPASHALLAIRNLSGLNVEDSLRRYRAHILRPQSPWSRFYRHLESWLTNPDTD